MFIQNRYTKLYYELLSIYIGQPGEKHHILPKSMGGSNSKDNIAEVPKRVHFILHRLLPKMVSSEYRPKMEYALWQMMNRNISGYTSRTYELQKVRMVEIMKETTKKQWAAGRTGRGGGKLRPLRIFDCPICNTQITTRIPNKTTCSNSCSGKLQQKDPIQKEKFDAGVKKMSQKTKGRKRIYREDGSWYYVSPLDYTVELIPQTI